MATLRQRGKTWYVDYRDKGRRFRISMGSIKSIAETAKKEIEVKIAKGEYLGIVDDKKVLFREYASEYLSYSKANKMEKSYGRDMLSVRHLLEDFGDELLSKITPAAIERYKEKRLESVKPASVNRELACLKHMFTKAVDWDYVRENPAKKVKLLKEPPGRLRYLTEEQMHRLLSECKGTLRSVVFTDINTGMRQSEILNLTWDAVDFTNKTITLRKTKNNEIRIISMNDPLVYELRKLYAKKQSLFVFSNKSGERFGYCRKAFARTVEKAGISDFTFHDLRHTFASHLIMKGVSIPVVQKLLGHKSIQMTMRYAHLSPEYEQDAVDRLGTLWAHKPSTDSEQGKKAYNTIPRRGVEPLTYGLRIRRSARLS